MSTRTFDNSVEILAGPITASGAPLQRDDRSQPFYGLKCIILRYDFSANLASVDIILRLKCTLTAAHLPRGLRAPMHRRGGAVWRVVTNSQGTDLYPLLVHLGGLSRRFLLPDD